MSDFNCRIRDPSSCPVSSGDAAEAALFPVSILITMIRLPVYLLGVVLAILVGTPLEFTLGGLGLIKDAVFESRSVVRSRYKRRPFGSLLHVLGCWRWVQGE